MQFSQENMPAARAGFAKALLSLNTGENCNTYLGLQLATA